MSKPRERNVEWNTRNDKGEIASWEMVQVELLMDLRDQLQKLNRVFECGNFLRIPHTLDQTRKAVTRLANRPAKRRKVAAVRA